jgi:hypothetical protein
LGFRGACNQRIGLFGSPLIGPQPLLLPKITLSSIPTTPRTAPKQPHRLLFLDQQISRYIAKKTVQALQSFRRSRPGSIDPKTGPFPAEIEVLDLTEGPHPSAATMGAVPTEEIDLSGIEKVRRFPYGLRR